MTAPENTFPARLRALRLGAGLSQRELGERLGKVQVTISGWEGGSREPSLTDLIRLAAIFGCTGDAMLGIGPRHDPGKCPLWVEEILPDLARLDGRGKAVVVAVVKALLRDGDDGSGGDAVPTL